MTLKEIRKVANDHLFNIQHDLVHSAGLPWEKLYASYADQKVYQSIVNYLAGVVEVVEEE